MTAGKLPYTTWKDNDPQGTNARLGPAHKQKHTPLKAPGLGSGADGEERDQGSTLPRAGTQDSARTEQQPRPFRPVPHPAPVPPPTRRNLAFPGRGRHEWNSPEADCTGYPATEIIHQLASGGGEGGQLSLFKVKSVQLPQSPTTDVKCQRATQKRQTPEPRGRRVPGID